MHRGVAIGYLQFILWTDIHSMWKPCIRPYGQKQQDKPYACLTDVVSGDWYALEIKQ